MPQKRRTDARQLSKSRRAKERAHRRWGVFSRISFLPGRFRPFESLRWEVRRGSGRAVSGARQEVAGKDHGRTSSFGQRGTRLLAHERIERKQPDLVYKLREESLTVIGKHGKLDPHKVQVTKWTVAAWFR